MIPQVAALMGPCAAGTAYIPGLADFVPMVKGRGSMALAGPHLVRAAVGEDVTQEELGGSRVHCRKSGVGDLEVADDPECIEAIKEYLSYFPAALRGGARRSARPPIRSTARDEELLDVLPESNRKPYDMYEVIRRIVDDGDYFDLKPQFAKTIITCLARFGGRPAGIVANQPKQLGGILDNDSADKAARFINLCNAYGIPLVYLMDVPGFMVGTKVEEAGIIRHGAKMLYATANATVPKITVILRKAYGAGYYVMCGRAYEPDLIVAWPSAEISVMGAEGAVEIIFRKQVEAAEDPAATKQELIEDFRKIIDVYVAAGNDMIDDVIDPRETRATICRALEMAAGKRVRAPVEAVWGRPGLTPAVMGVRMGAEVTPPSSPARSRARSPTATSARRSRTRRRSTPPRRGGSSTRAACTSTSTPAAPTARRATRSRTSWPSATRSRAEIGDAAIINFSTGTVGVSVAKRIAYLEAGRPEVAALNMGSLNYAKYSASRKDFVFSFVFANPFDEIIELLKAMRRLRHQARARVLRPRPRRLAGAARRHGPARRAAARRLRHGRGRRGAGHRAQPGRDGRQHAGARGVSHHWGVIGIGRVQWTMVAAALTLGGSVRVGLEDNFYLPDGTMARSNGELIAKARQMAQDCGRRPATVEEARALLGIAARAATGPRRA